jgi:serine/threonine-protein kinase
MVGETLAHFEILEFLGQGGFGQVYRARDTVLDRPVAIKVLPDSLSTDATRRARFRREARAASRLTHPNICTIYEFGQQGARSFIAMELVAGRTLKQRITQAPIQPAEAVDIAIQIGEGLAAAHAMGVLHLDIKSANIALSADDHVKILDFGLARLVGVDEPSPLETLSSSTETMIGTVSGTLPYMAPEQLRSLALDHRTDQFAFGVVCYEMLSGVLPFRGGTIFETASSILNIDPIALPSLAPGVPPEFARLVHQMLEKTPDRRVASTRDVLAALKDVRQQLASGEIRGELSSDTGRVSSSGMLRVDTRRVPSIAVLAFENLAADAENDYFSEGLSEDLTNALAHIPGIKVASRTSAFFFKGKRQDIRQIAAALGVETVLEGSVRKSGNRIRVTAQLINAADGYHIWSETYDRQVEDVFAIQDEVSRTIAETLEVKLLGSAQQSLAPRHTKNIEAYKLYLQGRYHWNRRYRGGMQAALRFFQQAADKDPTFALPHSGLADSLAVLGFYNYLPPHEAFPKAKASAEAALRSDDTLAEAHASLAFIKTFFDWDWDGADREFAAALKLEPNYAMTHWWSASSLLVRGRVAESDRELQRALKAEPWSAIISGGAAFHYYLRRDYEQGLAQARRSLELDAAFGPSFAFQGWCLLQLGRLDEAVELWRRSAELMQQLSLVQAMLGVTYARGGRDVEARQILLELIERSRSTWVAPYHVALLCAALGEIDEAFEWLERACEGHNPWLPFIQVDPCMDPLRNDPRLEHLAARVGLPRANEPSRQDSRS